tara:strand:+ start:695 stop:1126 length:432 start_codon:yes stop_codon:yes gene_type:complete
MDKFNLPEPVPANGNYAPFHIDGDLVYVSGQLPIRDGQLVTEAGSNSFIEIAQLQMEIITLNILSHVMSAVNGNKNKIESCVKLTAYLVPPDGFFEHALISNIGSDMINDFLQPAQNHTRTTIGIKSLPLGSLVEADAIFKIR